MSAMTAQALALSGELAALLKAPRRITREGRVFTVPAELAPPAKYKRSGRDHHVAWALDNELICDCEAASLGKRECWAVKAVQKEIDMTTEVSERALAVVTVTPPTALVMSASEMGLINQQAAMVFSGRVALPQELNSPEKIAAIMMYGWEMGLRPMTAIRHLYLVNGRIYPSTEVMAGLLLSRHPDARISVVELNNERCVMRLVWPSRDVNDTYVVTWDDIKRAKLDGGDVAQKYPQDRMRYHCTKRLLRIYAPDVINGLDQVAIGIDPEPAAPAPNMADLYNEGDGPDDYIDGQLVDRETGEMFEDAPPTPPATATAETVAALVKDCKATWSGGDFLRLWGGMKEAFAELAGNAKAEDVIAASSPRRLGEMATWLRQQRGEPTE